jgi:hypothetical protein
MKHLRKFNESLDNKDEMIEYIKLCFIEFYDKLGEGDNGVFTEELNDGESITFRLTMDEPELGDYSKGISEFVRHSDEVAEFYKEIENCLEKVAIRYDIETHFEYQWAPEGYITIIFVLDGTYENDEEEEEDEEIY